MIDGTDYTYQVVKIIDGKEWVDMAWHTYAVDKLKAENKKLTDENKKLRDALEYIRDSSFVGYTDQQIWEKLEYIARKTLEEINNENS